LDFFVDVFLMKEAIVDGGVAQNSMKELLRLEGVTEVIRVGVADVAHGHLKIVIEEGCGPFVAAGGGSLPDRAGEVWGSAGLAALR
jgi:hypothetical protein